MESSIPSAFKSYGDSKYCCDENSTKIPSPCKSTRKSFSSRNAMPSLTTSVLPEYCIGHTFSLEPLNRIGCLSCPGSFVNWSLAIIYVTERTSLCLLVSSSTLFSGLGLLPLFVSTIVLPASSTLLTGLEILPDAALLACSIA